MGRAGVGRRDAAAISLRLRGFVQNHYASWEEFCAVLGIPRTTADAWRRAKTPSVPDAAALLLMHRRANLDLTWLLVGEGRELWEPRTPDTGRRIEHAIEAELRNSEHVTPAEFQMAWDRLFHGGKYDFAGREDILVQLAAEGVRPRFRENVRLVHHYDGIITLINQFVPAMLEEGGPEGAKLVKRWREELHQALLVEISPHEPLAPRKTAT